MKTTFAIGIAALMTLTACGGSGSSNQVTEPDTKPKPQPTAGKYAGMLEGNNSELLSSGSDHLYTIKTTNGDVEVKMDTEMKFPTGAKDVEMTGVRYASGANGGAVFSKGLLHSATFGVVANYDMKGHYLYNYRTFFQGMPTNDMPGSGSAIYQGRVIQAQTGAEVNKPWIDATKGTVQAKADFANKTMQISLNNVQHPAGIEAATIVGNTFTGKEKGIEWTGGFFGKGAAEMAGMARSTEWSAAYGGVKK